MEDLQAAYGYDEDNDASETPTPPQSITVALNGGATGATLSTPVVVAGMKPDLPKIDRVNAIQAEIGTAVSKDVLSEEISLNRITQALDAYQIGKRDSQNSPNPALELDLPEIDRVNVIKKEIGNAASKDVLPEEISLNRITQALDAYQIEKRDSQNSPNLVLEPNLPEIISVNVMKEAIGTVASKDVLSEEISLNKITQAVDGYQIEKHDSQNSPNLDLETNAGEKEEEEKEVEEPPLKKQKQLTDLPKATTPKHEITEMPPPSNTIPPQPQNGKQPTGRKSKKKKSKDVWATTSRRGKKKTKHASNYNRRSDNIIPLTGEKVVFSSVLHYPERDDDSPNLKICLSKIFKTEKVVLSEDRLSASSTKGYRMVRATRGVTHGAWYFEIKVVHLGETGHTRLGWSTEKGDLQAPVGFDSNSYGYRDIDGIKVHKALREKYGDEGYKEGDVIGFYINLPDGGSYLPNPQELAMHKGKDPPKAVPESEISYFKNGVCQGVAFRDIYAGCYYPAASMYTLPNQPPCVVKFNFGPGFERFPEDFGERPVPKPMIEVPYHSDCKVENGGPWNITRIFPMLKVMKGKTVNL